MFEIYAPTPDQLKLADIAAFARRVEKIGYDGLFVSDAVHDGLLLAALALAATSRLKVATSVLVAFPRSPMNVALAAWDLQQMSGGRFELGLGTQIRQNIEDRYSARWLPPASGMRDYLAALRAIFAAFRSGGPLRHEGPFYRFTRLQPFFNPGPIDAPDPQLMVGAIGPKMLALAGECADGLHTHPSNTSPRYLREVILSAIDAVSAARDPALAKPCISISQFVAAGSNAAALAQERERFRAMLAFLFSTPAYWPSLELHGWGELGRALLQASREQRWAEMSALLGDDVLDAFVVSGRYEELPELLHQRFDGLADRVSMTVPPDPLDDERAARVIGTLRGMGS